MNAQSELKMKKVLFALCQLLSTCLISPTNVLTNSYQWDGFGAQYLVIIGSMVDAERKNCEFKYTPFSKMEHNYDNDPYFLKKKEWLINIIDNIGLAFPDTPKAECNYHHIQGGGKIFHESKSLKKVKEMFRANKMKELYLNPDRFHIAIHVRRHNSHDSRIDGTDTPDELYLKIIAALHKKYYFKKPLFHLFSQGDEAQFKKYSALDTIFHLNENIENTFISMVFADVLVMSRSAFSYVAGLISEGTLYYIPFACQPLPHWVSVNDLLLQA